MPRPLLFSAFVMNTTSHILHGVWRRPDARQIEFNSLELWVNLAKELEAGLFDVIFLRTSLDCITISMVPTENTSMRAYRFPATIRRSSCLPWRTTPNISGWLLRAISCRNTRSILRVKFRRSITPPRGALHGILSPMRWSMPPTTLARN